MNFINQSPLSSIQKTLFKSFESLGIPTRKNEAYKYTKVHKRLNNDLSKAPATLSQRSTPQVPEGFVYLEINHNKLSNEEIEYHFAEVDNEPKNDPLYNLCLSQVEKKIQINLKKDQKVFINHVNQKNSFQCTSLEIKTSAGNEIIESFDELPQDGLSLIQTKIKSESKVAYYKVDTFKNNAALTHFLDIELNGNKSHLDIFQLSVFEGEQHFVPTLKLNTSDIVTTFDTFYNLKGKSAFSLNSHTSHLTPSSFSNQDARGILNDSSQFSFQGRVFIGEKCAKVEANQFNKNILIGERAQAISRPELEIFNDDVKCSHGSTTGQISSEELFYLTSRGLSKEKATKMLIKANSTRFLDAIQNSHVKKYFKRQLQGIQ